MKDEKMVRVTVRMPAAQRDRLAKRAEKAGVPMAEYVRSLLAKRVLAGKPEFTEAARRLEQMILDLQAALTEPRKAAS